jgi:enoyl-CoA hydratase
VTVLTVEPVDDGAVMTLNRPDSGNSLSPELVDALHTALDAFTGRVLILRGAGRHFCTGFDLSDVEQASDADMLLRFVRIEQLLARLWSAQFVTIAVAQGRVMGAGADIVAACARSIAVDDCSFAFPGAKFGLVLGTRRLTERVGADRARALVLSGQPIAARDALGAGLITSHVTADELDVTLAAEINMAVRLDIATVPAILSASGDATDRLNGDLAALVRSAARPGIVARIIAYRAAAQAARATSTHSPSR